MKKILLLFTILSGCSHINERFGLDDDNFIEELIEWKIEDSTNLDIDLTPDSVE
jgi:hypothetical protein